MICLEEKTPSRMRRFKNWVAEYLVGDPVSSGYDVWQELNLHLPAPVGATENDKSRLEEFEKLIRTLSFLDYYALKEYLRFSYKRMEDGTYGSVTGGVEQYCVKWMQIYSQHYNVME